MNGAGTQIPQGLVMRLGAIALVDLKAIAGIFGGHSLHIIVTGGSNIGATAIALDHRFYIYTKILLSIAVDQGQLRLNFQLRQCPLHSKKSGL